MSTYGQWCMDVRWPEGPGPALHSNFTTVHVDLCCAYKYDYVHDT